jgi:WD40 repeat protein
MCLCVPSRYIVVLYCCLALALFERVSVHCPSLCDKRDVRLTQQCERPQEHALRNVLEGTSIRVELMAKDCTVRVWDITKVGSRMDFSLAQHTKRWGDKTSYICSTVPACLVHLRVSITCVKWGGQGLIYTASQDTTIKVWRANDGALCRTLQVLRFQFA